MEEAKGAGYDVDEVTAWRFLIAREWDYEKGRDLLFEDLEWREDHPEYIHIDDAEIATELESNKAYLHGFDRAGRPIMVFLLRLHNKHERDLEESTKYLMRQILRGIKMAEANGQLQFSILLDRYDTGRANSDTTIVKSLMGMISDHYPERLGSAYVLYPNWLFWIVHKIAKAFLPKRTMDKVFLFSGATMFDDLHQHIAPDQLQPDYNGTSDYIYDYRNEVEEDAARSLANNADLELYSEEEGTMTETTGMFYTATEASFSEFGDAFDLDVVAGESAAPGDRRKRSKPRNADQEEDEMDFIPVTRGQVLERIRYLTRENDEQTAKLDAMSSRISRLDSRIKNPQASLSQSSKSCCLLM